jgi:hypothetical protein
MDLDTPKVIVKKQIKKNFVTESKVKFEFENFKSYAQEEKITAEIKIPEIDAIW